jgi:transposase-like protein
MTKQERRVFSEELKLEAVRLLETSGGTIAQIAGGLGVGLSTLIRP